MYMDGLADMRAEHSEEHDPRYLEKGDVTCRLEETE